MQSINLFATDLLDYFITLENGCWDVIIGITPNSLESTLRGKDLLERIAYLDTIDDRVQKLWLSDEYGSSSSFLNEDNCTEYARLYLNEYKQQNAQPCNETCPVFHRCHYLESDRSENLLAPFNKEVLVRLFRSLPQGKGRARYFTLYLRDILLRFTQGEEPLQVLQEYVKTEWAVYYADRKLSQLYELYGSFLQENNSASLEIAEHEHLHQFFEVQVPHYNQQLPVVASLSKQSSEPASVHHAFALDPGKEAIKAWLQGEVVNKQLLKNIRRGITKAIKEAYPLDNMTRLYTARPQRVLRWAQSRLDTVPPIVLEGVDDFDGLHLDRSVGPFAYVLHDFADAGGWTELDLRNTLLTHEIFPSLLFESMVYRKNVQTTLEEQLGMRIEEFAFSLLLLAVCFNQLPMELPVLLRRKIEATTVTLPIYPDGLEDERPRLTNSQIRCIKRLFDDCFKLRENVYDGLLLEQLAENISAESAFHLLQSIDAAAIEADYRLNEEPLGTFVAALQHTIETLAQLRSHKNVRTRLIAISKIEASTGNASERFASLIGLSNDIEGTVSHFLQVCTPLELHQVLCIACDLERIQHEQLLLQIRSLLDGEDAGNSENATHRVSGFSHEEIKTLVDFIQQDGSILLAQIEMSLLEKLSKQMPGIYHRLELRLQRG